MIWALGVVTERLISTGCGRGSRNLQGLGEVLCLPVEGNNESENVGDGAEGTGEYIKLLLLKVTRLDDMEAMELGVVVVGG